MTAMFRKMECTVCGYEQTDSVSYYLHAKAWKANHDLEKCLAIRKGK
jgi:ribosomal protein L37E